MNVTLFLWLLASILLMVFFNAVSGKINYGYSRRNQLFAILLNLLVWSGLYYKALRPIVDRGDSIPYPLALLALITTILISITFIDLLYYEIPNSYNAIIALLGIVYIFQAPQSLWVNLFLGGIIAFVAFLILNIVSGGNLGMGDVKMVGGLGLFLGMNLLLNYIFITFLTGVVISIILLAFKVIGRKDKIAFGPYIGFGFIWMLIS